MRSIFWVLLLFAPSKEAALQASDMVARLSFKNGTKVDASDLVRLALDGPGAPKHFAPAYAFGRNGR
jgi:hypothetical protein